MNSLQNALFLVSAKIRRGSSCEMPAHLVGALVDCFVAAPDHLSALRAAVEAIRTEGYVFEELVDGKVIQLDPALWPGLLERQYPDLVERLPAQPDAADFLMTGGVFFGPFLGWEREGSADALIWLR